MRKEENAANLPRITASGGKRGEKPSSVGGIHALQRMIGNRSAIQPLKRHVSEVAGVSVRLTDSDKLENDHTGSNQPSSEQAPIQGIFAVQAGLIQEDTGNGMVDKVASLNIGDRPKGIFGNEDGGHATSWEVYCDLVRKKLVGKPFLEACEILYQLMDNVDRLPTNSRTDDLQGIAKTNFQEANTVLETKKALVESLVGLEQNQLTMMSLSIFQGGVAAYLQFRNTMPLSAVYRGKGMEKGSGEPDKLAKVRYVESGNTTWSGKGAAPNLNRTETLQSMWGLLDYSVIQFLLDNNDPDSEPGIRIVDGMLNEDEMDEESQELTEEQEEGINEELAERVGLVIAQHLMTMQEAYPVAFEQSNMGSEESVTAYLKARFASMPTNKEDKKKKKSKDVDPVSGDLIPLIINSINTWHEWAQVVPDEDDDEKLSFPHEQESIEEEDDSEEF